MRRGSNKRYNGSPCAFFPDSPHFDINNRNLFLHAEKAITFVTERCPYGPANLGNSILARKKYYQLRSNECDNLKFYTNDELLGLPSVMAYFLRLDKTRVLNQNKEQTELEKIQLHASAGMLFGTGTCTEFSCIAFLWLVTRQDISSLQIITVSNDRESHTVVALNGMRFARDYQNLIVCDPWLKLSFRFSEWNDFCVDNHRITERSTITISYDSKDIAQDVKLQLHEFLARFTETELISQYRSQVAIAVSTEQEKSRQALSCDHKCF